MSEFKGRKFIEDTSIPTDEYLKWLEDRVVDLEQKLESANRRNVNLSKQLESYRRHTNRQYRDDADYLPYQEDDRYD